MFDVIRFLDDHGIQWWPAGSPNVSRGHVGVTCPFCDDNYNHLGLDVQGERTPYCWKCGTHSWYDYVKAVSGENVRQVEKRYKTIFSHQAAYIPEIPRGTASVCVPPGDTNFKEAHKQYLAGRGFDPEYVIRKYKLQVTGKVFGEESGFSYRIIIPILLNGKVVSYQGRSYADSKPKYLTCSPEKEVVFHKDTLYNVDNARGRSVIIVEGAIDTMKLGDNTVATFGTAFTKSQLNQIYHRYDRGFLLFDGEEKAQKIAREKARTLASLGLDVEVIMLDYGDAGDLSSDDAIHLKSELGVI